MRVEVNFAGGAVTAAIDGKIEFELEAL